MAHSVALFRTESMHPVRLAAARVEAACERIECLCQLATTAREHMVAATCLALRLAFLRSLHVKAEAAPAAKA